jgi:hypothetical protein
VPRQDSQRNGKKSSCRQYSIWQWAPMSSRSTSFMVATAAIGVYDVSWLVDLGVVESDGFWLDIVGRLWGFEFM